jgi:hypothetical protein
MAGAQRGWCQLEQAAITRTHITRPGLHGAQFSDRSWRCKIWHQRSFDRIHGVRGTWQGADVGRFLCAVLAGSFEKSTTAATESGRPGHDTSEFSGCHASAGEVIAADDFLWCCWVGPLVTGFTRCIISITFVCVSSGLLSWTRTGLDLGRR